LAPFSFPPVENGPKGETDEGQRCGLLSSPLPPAPAILLFLVIGSRPLSEVLGRLAFKNGRLSCSRNGTFFS